MLGFINNNSQIINQVLFCMAIITGVIAFVVSIIIIVSAAIRRKKGEISSMEFDQLYILGSGILALSILIPMLFGGFLRTFIT